MSAELDALTKKLNRVLKEKGQNSPEYHQLLDKINRLSSSGATRGRIKPISPQSNGTSVDKKSLFHKDKGSDKA